MTGSRSTKSRASKAKRKRRSTRQHGDDVNDSDDSVNNDGSAEKWNYDIETALSKKEFDHPDVFDKINAKDFNINLIRKTGFSKPILLTDPPAEFNFKMPNPANFSVEDVRSLVGGDREIEVVEVDTQSSRQMSLGAFVDYYTTPPEKRSELLNVLSLEFSHTKLEDYAYSPELTRRLDWVDLFWPKELRSVDPGTDLSCGPFKYPKVKQYCLMSVKDCYTDFHIDFGGTSVWYHVLKGRKVFWMVEPTEQNLKLYEEWILTTSSGNSAFFGDIVEKCARVELGAGSTFLIPSGWIHGVYTLSDSLIFGGNFLHSFSIPMHIRITRSEDKIRVTKKYRYPYFNDMLWFVVNGVVERATGHSYLLPFDRTKTKNERPAEVGVVEHLQHRTNLEKESEKDKGLGDSGDDHVQLCVVGNGQSNKLEVVLSPEGIEWNSLLNINKEFLETMTKKEYDGYCVLLKYLRKKQSTRNKLEIIQELIDPDQLLNIFEQVLKHKINTEKSPSEYTSDYKNYVDIATDIDDKEVSKHKMEIGKLPSERANDHKNDGDVVAGLDDEHFLKRKIEVERLPSECASDCKNDSDVVADPDDEQVLKHKINTEKAPSECTSDYKNDGVIIADLNDKQVSKHKMEIEKLSRECADDHKNVDDLVASLDDEQVSKHKMEDEELPSECANDHKNDDDIIAYLNNEQVPKSKMEIEEVQSECINDLKIDGDIVAGLDDEQVAKDKKEIEKVRSERASDYKNIVFTVTGNDDKDFVKDDLVDKNAAILRSETNDALSKDMSCDYEDVALNVEVSTFLEDAKFNDVDENIDKELQDVMQQVVLPVEKSDSESVCEEDGDTVLHKVAEDVRESSVNKTVLDSDDIEVDVVDEDSKEDEDFNPKKKRSLTNKEGKSKQKQRGVKRKLVNRDKVGKSIKSKNRKNDGSIVDRPLIVGGLPPAIMPADAPKAPNPYQYDPKAAVTALGHRQLPSAYRVMPGMASAPPTQKFRLHPVNRTTGVIKKPVASVSSVEPDEKIQDSPVTSSATESVASEPKTDEKCHKEILDSLADKEEVEKPHARSTMLTGLSKEKVMRHTTRNAGREKKPSEHTKLSSVEFEYRSPLAHTYIHSAVPSNSSQIKPVVGVLKKDQDVSPLNGASISHQRYKDGEKRYGRTSFKRDSPARRLSSEEMWDSRYGRRRGNSRYVPYSPVSQERKFRRFSYEERRGNVENSHRSDLCQDRNFDRSERWGNSEFQRSPRDKNYQDFRRPHANTSRGTWKRPSRFDSPAAPIVTPEKRIQEDTALVNHMGLPKTKENTSNCSESWRRLASDLQTASRDTKVVSSSPSSVEKNSLHSATPQIEQKSQIDNVKKNSEQSVVPKALLVVDSSRKATKDDAAGNGMDEFQEGYRPTPICDLPPRPDGILGIPPIIFEQDHKVTGILKRPHNVRNSQSACAISPQISHEKCEENMQKVIVGYGGTNVVGNDFKKSLETNIAHKESDRNLLAGEAKKEPLDYVSTANELARLTSEITEDLAHPTSEFRLKKSESSTILTDPRRVKNATSGNKLRFDNHSDAANQKLGDGVESATESASSLFEDLSSLIAEYDEIDD